MILRTVDGVIGGYVKVIQVGRYLEAFGNVGEVLVFRRSHAHGFTEISRLFHGFLSPHARIDVTGLMLEQVVRYVEELGAGTAAEEKHMIALRHAEQLLEQSYRLVHHCLKLLGTV